MITKLHIFNSHLVLLQWVKHCSETIFKGTHNIQDGVEANRPVTWPCMDYRHFVAHHPHNQSVGLEKKASAASVPWTDCMSTSGKIPS